MKPHSGRFLQDVLSTSRTYEEDPPSDAASSSSLPLNKAAFRHNPASFDSSMGLTALVLLSALFFIGFFSIYIRRCAEDSNAAAAAAFRRRRHPPPPYSSPLPWLSSSAKGGLDPSTARSLPLISYGGDAKHPIDCVICLSEFEGGETVKLIPSCSHVFHPQCIDTWLSSHVSCPLCRCTQMFAATEVRICVTQAEDNHQERSTVDNHNTTEEVGPVETRRSWSCSNLSLLGDRMAMLQRSLSL